MAPGEVGKGGGLPWILPLNGASVEDLRSSIPGGLQACDVVQLGFATAEDGRISFNSDVADRDECIVFLVNVRRALRQLGLSRREDTMSAYKRQLRLLTAAREKQYVLCGSFCTTIQLHMTPGSDFAFEAKRFEGVCALFCLAGGAELRNGAEALGARPGGAVHCASGQALFCAACDLPRLHKREQPGSVGESLFILLASDAGVVRGGRNDFTAKPQVVRKWMEGLAEAEADSRARRRGQCLRQWKLGRASRQAATSSTCPGTQVDAEAKTHEEAKQSNAALGGGESGKVRRKRIRSKSGTAGAGDEQLQHGRPPVARENPETPTERRTARACDDSPSLGRIGDVVPSVIGDVVPTAVGDEDPRKVGDVVAREVGDGVLTEWTAIGADADFEQTPRTSFRKETTVHRYWVSSDKRKSLPDLCLASLKSFSPEYKQIVWVYTPLEDPGVANVVYRDAEQVVPRELYSEMVSMKASPQQISDVFKARVIYLQGGWAIDLDFIYLGRPLPTSSPAGICLHSEPERSLEQPFARQDSLVRRCHDAEVGWCTLNCGLVGGKQKDEFWSLFEKQLLDDWRTHYKRLRSNLGKGRHIGQPSMLMGAWSLQHVVLAALKHRRSSSVELQALEGSRLDPMTACPLPRFLRVWHDSQATEVHGYKVPGAKEIAEQSSCIQLWERKWPGSVLRHVLDFAVRLREGRRLADPSLQLEVTWSPIVQAAEHQLTKVVCVLSVLYENVALAYTVVAGAMTQLRRRTAAELRSAGVRDPSALALVSLLCSHRTLHSREDGSFGEGLGFFDAERRMCQELLPGTSLRDVEHLIARWMMMIGGSSLLVDHGDAQASETSCGPSCGLSSQGEARTSGPVVGVEEGKRKSLQGGVAGRSIGEYVAFSYGETVPQELSMSPSPCCHPSRPLLTDHQPQPPPRLQSSRRHRSQPPLPEPLAHATGITCRRPWELLRTHLKSVAGFCGITWRRPKKHLRTPLESLADTPGITSRHPGNDLQTTTGINCRLTGSTCRQPPITC